MKLSTKLYLSLVYGIFIVLAIAVVSYVLMGNMEKHLGAILERQVDPLLTANMIEQKANEVVLLAMRHVSTTETEDMTTLEQELDSKLKDLDQIARSYIKSVPQESSVAALIQDFNERWSSFQEVMKTALEANKGFDQESALLIMTSEAQQHFQASRKILGDLVQVHRQNMTELRNDTESLIFQFVFFMAGILIFTGVVYVVVLFMIRAAFGALRRVIASLDSGADQVSEVANRISSSSQTLADGASQQAASLENTSSSLEEMSSMTRNNAENAIQVRNLAEETSSEVNKLMDAMDDIMKASTTIAGITKVIDSIAFQTNILSLNAAVEAARAGEAGMGFAVVADEVRNLALKSAESAQDIANSIENSVQKTKAGGDLTKRVVDTFELITQRIAEISAASQEQSSGINQVNQAVTQIDQVTQHTASAAADNTQAVSRLHGQVENLRSIIHNLSDLAGTSVPATSSEKVAAVSTSVSTNSRRASAVTRPLPSQASPPSSHSTPASAPHSSAPTPPVRDAKKLIPMDDESFEDF